MISRDVAASGAAPVALETRLPGVGTTVFAVMSRLAADHGAINLSQGYPDFDGPARLLELVTEYLQRGYNQYPPMMGVEPLRQAIATKVAGLYGRPTDPETEVTVTSGATEALFCAIAATVRAGDEVIVFDPAYDSYAPAVALAGGVTRHIPLVPPTFSIDWERVAAAITPRTRLIIVNTPHNPSGTIWSADDMRCLEELAERHDLLVVGDEVYEHIVFDGAVHQSLLRHPGLAVRSFAISSFGKTYHTTGWKVGYCVAPAALTTELRKIHQFVTFTTITPVQHAIAQFMTEHPEHHEQLSTFYQQRRDQFRSALAASRLHLLPAQGTFFQTADFSAISDQPDTDFVQYLTRDVGVAAIPLSVLHAEPGPQQFVRFCFAKQQATLEEAAARLCQL